MKVELSYSYNEKKETHSFAFKTTNATAIDKAMFWFYLGRFTKHLHRKRVVFSDSFKKNKDSKGKSFGLIRPIKVAERYAELITTVVDFAKTRKFENEFKEYFKTKK